MSSVYQRLGYNFDSTKFNGADVLTTGANNYLSNTTINLSQWQIDDIANNTATGYYQNPHSNVITFLTSTLVNMSNTCNVNNTTFTNSANIGNNIIQAASDTLSSLSNFLLHTNNLSGLTYSSNSSMYPDLYSAMAIGRQILNLTYKTDSVQNNTPILGNFTSLYIGSDLSSSNTIIANDYITILNSISAGSSNLSNSVANVIIADITSLQTLVDVRRNADITFYTNSMAISRDYQTVLQFSNIGATQNSLITLIGTPKLLNNLYP